MMTTLKILMIQKMILKMNLLMRQKIKKMFLHRIQMKKLSRKMNLRLKKLKRIKGITGFYGKIQR